MKSPLKNKSEFQKKSSQQTPPYNVIRIKVMAIIKAENKK